MNNYNNKNNNKNKVTFLWVLVVFIITISIAFANISEAKTVKQYNIEQNIDKQQQELDFPVLENWPAGNGEEALWVNPDQSLSPVGFSNVYLDTPDYKVNLNSNEPDKTITSANRVYRGVAKINLLSW